jgi:MYXO-CTERM domain-containing protein
MIFNRSLFFFAATVIFLPRSLPASTIFTTGPDDGVDAQIAIEFGYATTEAFTLTSSVTLNQVTFDDWAAPGNPPGLIDWEITSQPNAGVLFSGTRATLSNTLVGSGHQADGFTNQIYDSSFQTGAIKLGPGTYWLLLKNCGPDPNQQCGWGESSSTGGVQQYLNGVLYQSNFGTQSFTLSGSVAATPTGAPEPAGLLPLGGLLLAIALSRRRR